MTNIRYGIRHSWKIAYKSAIVFSYWIFNWWSNNRDEERIFFSFSELFPLAPQLPTSREFQYWFFAATFPSFSPMNDPEGIFKNIQVYSYSHRLNKDMFKQLNVCLGLHMGQFLQDGKNDQFLSKKNIFCRFTVTKRFDFFNFSQLFWRDFVLYILKIVLFWS